MKIFLYIFLIILTSAQLCFSQDSTKVKEKAPSQTEGVKHGKGFVDENGDGFNDNAPDHDGDGIPNGLDPDYQKLKKKRKMFIDLDGDGINDYKPGKGHGNKMKNAITNPKATPQNENSNSGDPEKKNARKGNRGRK